MGERMDSAHLIDSVGTLIGYLNDLGRVRFDDASTKIRLVVGYASKDRVVRPLTERLRVRFPREEFFERLEGEGMGIPGPGGDRMAFLYDLLVHLKSGHKISLRDLLTSRSVFSGGLDQRWKTFQTLVAKPLEEEARKLQAWLRENLEEGMVDPEEAFAQAITWEASPAARPAASRSGAPRSSKLEALDAAVRAASLGPAEGDVLVDVELLELELRKSAPCPERLRELVEGFSEVSASLGGAAQACLSSGQDAAVAHAEPTVAVAAPPAPKPSRPPAPQPTPSAPPAPATDPGLEAERQTLEAERASLRAERAALEAERAALKAERQALEAERKALDSRREQRP